MPKYFLTNLAQKTLRHYYHHAGKSFFNSLTALQENQLGILQNILKQTANSQRGRSLGIKGEMSYQEFTERIPLSSYEDYDELIQQQLTTKQKILCEQIEKYQPTSGSTHKRKWIPYNKSLLQEFDHAITPWLCGLYEQFPEVAKGKHYWSLSWMPDDLRTTMASNDDLDYFPWWKRIFMSLTMAVPPDLAKVKTSDASIIASLAHLCACSNLTLISIWSPTYLLSLLRRLKEDRAAISQILNQGSWGPWEKYMLDLPCPQDRFGAKVLQSWDGEINPSFTKELWPELKVISSWSTALAGPWAREIQNLFPHAKFQGKGLFATEAVVTIPYQDKYLLSYQSHFYEFLRESDGKVIPAWQLEQGDIVSPVVTCGNGFLRYQVQDRLLVDSFLKSIPSLVFLGRNKGLDMVGEKLTGEVAEELLQELAKLNPELVPVSLLAVTAKDCPPYYVALLQASTKIPSEQVGLMAQQGETMLRQHFHYGVARDLNQLNALKVRVSSTAFKEYQDVAVKKGMIAGDLKVEPLLMAGEFWHYDD